MAAPVLNGIDVLLGVTGVITFSAVVLNNLRVMQNFTHNQDVSMTMFFLRRESVQSIRALVYGALVFAGTVTISAIASLFGVTWVDLAAKIGAAVFMMTYLLFYEVIARITAPGEDRSLWTRIVGTDWSIGSSEEDEDGAVADSDTDEADPPAPEDDTDSGLVPGPEGTGRQRDLPDGDADGDPEDEDGDEADGGTDPGTPDDDSTDDQETEDDGKDA